ncbi:MAG: hypothetical protein GF313_16035 [Caldithrix sp.]|nr:hypothetical protein [Caldithrix sp.]
MKFKPLILSGLMILIFSRTEAQNTTLDWKMYNIGNVRQVITNTGGMNAKYDASFAGYTRLINSEYPPNSFEEHLTEGGLWIGAVADGDTVVSVTEGETADREFYPTGEPWDSIWVVPKDKTVDIPYWFQYKGVSDLDYVCRYNDYGPASQRLTDHTPMYLDVIQTTYAWSSAPIHEIIVFRYYIISNKYDLQNVYLTSWINGNVGYGLSSAHGYDDETHFLRNERLQYCFDLPGGEDGTAKGPVATKIFPPPQATPNIRTTFQWYNGNLEGLPTDDRVRYAQMSRGRIMQDQANTGNGTKSMVSIGPYQIAKGDTLQLTVGLLVGDGKDGLMDNLTYLNWLIEQDFGVPSPPPSPPLRSDVSNHQVTLNWQPQEGDVNPEDYTDPYRADSSAKPFEGYRIYKSTQSIAGPWTLLASFDLRDNEYESNTGLQYRYTDLGLLNNLEYYYTITAFSKPDKQINFPSLESSINANAVRVTPSSPSPASVGKVKVVPNPYRGDIAYHQYDPPWEKVPGGRLWMEQDRRIQFINLPSQCMITIYTLAGDLVQTLEHNSNERGYEDWNLTSSVGQAIASGIYLFTVEDRNKKVQTGKFVIIK